MKTKRASKARGRKKTTKCFASNNSNANEKLPMCLFGRLQNHDEIKAHDKIYANQQY